MTGPLFGANETDLVAELLSLGAILRLGVADPKAAALLVDKARRRDGHLAGEREEMALVGLLTIQILAHAYFEDFDARGRRRRRQLDASEMHVFVDLAGAARSQDPCRGVVDARPDSRTDEMTKFSRVALAVDTAAEAARIEAWIAHVVSKSSTSAVPSWR